MFPNDSLLYKLCSYTVYMSQELFITDLAVAALQSVERLVNITAKIVLSGKLKIQYLNFHSLDERSERYRLT